MARQQNPSKLTRQKEAETLNFCLRQARAFAREEWLAFNGVPKRDLAAIASFLAAHQWYGHTNELLGVVVCLGVKDRIECMQDSCFDLPRFVGMLKRQGEMDGTF